MIHQVAVSVINSASNQITLVLLLLLLLLEF